MRKLFGVLAIFFILLAGWSLERSAFNNETLMLDVLEKFYGNSCEPILIFEQVPFAGGTLVLAERLMDGENYPDLHFVDEQNQVTHLTLGSYCWTLNYTQFRGHYIYFGLAGVETCRYGGNSVLAEKVEAFFPDRVISVSVGNRVIENNDQRMAKFLASSIENSGGIDNPQGYIMPVPGRDIPENLVVVLKNGEKKSLTEIYTDRNSEYRPDYLKSKQAQVYNSFAFTFTPMLTPGEWDKGKEGEICLERQTDGNGNRNALFLQAAGHMSPADSYILPQDLKPLYLSDNSYRQVHFSAGETVTVKFPGKRTLLDCRLLRLTRETVEKEIGQDSLALIQADEKNRITLPEAEGAYLFLLRTLEGDSIQTYTGLLTVD